MCHNNRLARPEFHPVSTGDFLQGVECETDYTPPSSSAVKNVCIYTS